jgi:hypothetical protein
MYDCSNVDQVISTCSRAPSRRSQVSNISTISYSGPAHLLFGGIRNSTRLRRPACASSRTRSKRSRTPSMLWGVQIVAACSPSPGISSGRMPAPVAITSFPYGTVRPSASWTSCASGSTPVTLPCTKST